MKTKILDPSFTKFLILGIACATLIASAAGTSSAQSSQFNETPDPYFKQRANPSTSQYAQTDPASARREPVPPLWTAPRTNVKPHIEQTQSKPSIEWNFPSVSAKVDKQNVAGQPGSLQPVNSTLSDSIIREHKAQDSNGFSARQGNSSGSPMKPHNVPGTPTSPTANQNDFQSSSFPVQQSNFLAPESKIQTAPLDPQPPSNNSLESKSRISIKPNSAGTAKEEELQSFEPGKVLALVGGEPIFVGDLNFEINQMIEKFMPGAPPAIKERERQKMIPQILPKFVESKILFLGAMRSLPEGVDLEKILEQASKEFDEKALEKMITGSGLKSPTEFDAQLRSFGSSLRKLRRSWSVDQLTKYFVGQKLNVDSEVSHQEMLDSYRENIDSYAVPAKTRWEQVMIRYDRSPSKAAAKETLEKLGNEVVYGANLQALAKKHSHGFLASEGGQHDWTTKGALVLMEIDEAIFTLPIGELSDIIETRDGVHIVRVLERTEATRKPFLDAQVEIKERILEEKRKKAFEEHITKLKREIPVEYFLNDTETSSIQNVTPRTAKR